MIGKITFAGILLWIPFFVSAEVCSFPTSNALGGKGGHGGLAGQRSSQGKTSNSIKDQAEQAMSSYERIAFKSPDILSAGSLQAGQSSSNPNSRTYEAKDTIPFSISQNLSFLELSEEAGYRSSMRNASMQWVYGLALACALRHNFSLLGEWRGNLPQDFSNHSSLVNVGGVLAFTKKISILLSLSRVLQNIEVDQPTGLLTYAGMQFKW